MSRPIKKGSTSQSVVIRIIDSGDGTPETAVNVATAGLDLWYRREGGLSVDIAEVTLATLDAAWASGGFLAINDGYYRVDYPDAAFASTAGVNGVMFGGAVTSMVVIGCYVPLVNYDPYGAVFFATGGIAASSFAAGAIDVAAFANAAITASVAPNLNATITSRASADAYTSARAGYLDKINTYLDASITTVDLVVDSNAVGIASLLAHDTTQEVALASLLSHDTTQEVALASLLAHLTLVEADTNELQTDWVNGGRLDLILDGTPAAVWDVTAASHATAGTMGEEQQLHALSSEIAALNDLSSADVSAAVLAAVIEGTITLQQAERLMLAVLTGKVSGGGTSLATFRDTGDTVDRVVATIDALGNRTAVTRDPS